MLILALDSSATASVALARLDSENPGSTATILAARESADTRSHAEVMSPFVSQVLDEAQVNGRNVDAILTGTGPGPFTGLRAGIVTARTLGFAWNKPVYGLMSLTALAERAFVQDFQGKAAQKTEILVASDARRREIYSAIFTVTENGYTIKTGPQVAPASESTPAPGSVSGQNTAGYRAYGYGAELYREQLEQLGVQISSELSQLHPNASDLVRAAARLGIKNLSTDTRALYLRDSDAKVPAAMLARQSQSAPSDPASSKG